MLTVLLDLKVPGAGALPGSLEVIIGNAKLYVLFPISLFIVRQQTLIMPLHRLIALARPLL